MMASDRYDMIVIGTGVGGGLLPAHWLRPANGSFSSSAGTGCRASQYFLLFWSGGVRASLLTSVRKFIG